MSSKRRGAERSGPLVPWDSPLGLLLPELALFFVPLSASSTAVMSGWCILNHVHNMAAKDAPSSELHSK